MLGGISGSIADPLRANPMFCWQRSGTLRGGNVAAQSSANSTHRCADDSGRPPKLGVPRSHEVWTLLWPHATSTRTHLPDGRNCLHLMSIQALQSVVRRGEM